MRLKRRRHDDPGALDSVVPPLTPRLSSWGRTFVYGVGAAGGATIIWSVAQLIAYPVDNRWLLLAALTIFSAPFSIRLPSFGARVSASEAFIFALALLFGPAPATLTVAIDGLLVSLRLGKRGLPRTLFNVAEPALSVWISSQLFYLIAGGGPLFGQTVAVIDFLWPLLVLTTSYFILNSGLTACAVAFETRSSPFPFLRSNAPHLAINYAGSLCLVVLVVHQATNLLFAVGGVIIPLLMMSHFSSRTSVARVEDTNRHLAEVNSLYLSMVETLAMAIDAKDQVTHGHIRRVQLYAVALARALGVKNEMEIKALEAAGLLHDLGKLAVPEHILNKPGRLTPVEFDEMKGHAALGADILSNIRFPYPVTPIVRHHHERWDGLGYPDGLSGEAIPLGARILAVVDCFDALTSDRPYRRRLADEEALEYLKSERAIRYDARVVDAFVAVCPTLAREDAEVDRQNAFQRVAAPTVAPAPVPALQPGDALAAEIRDCRASCEHRMFDVIGSSVTRFIQGGLTGSVCCTLYHYDRTRGDLIAAYVSDDDYAYIRNIRIPLGERLSGWVGAQRQTIANSDPALDLGVLIEDLKSRPRNAMSVPLVWNDSLTGVLALYALADTPFDTQQIHRITALAPAIAEFVARDFEPLSGSIGSTVAPVEVTGPRSAALAGLPVRPAARRA